MNEQAGKSINTADLAARTTFFEALTDVAISGLPLNTWLERIDALLNLESCLTARKAEPDDLAAWADITRHCQEGAVLAEFSLDDFARGGGRPDTVTLTTLHSSKGLEYDVVIMPGLEEGRLPRYSAESDAALAEARRVFYVGMTRARNVVYLLYSGWNRNQYGRRFENGPSRFVEELQDVACSST